MNETIAFAGQYTLIAAEILQPNGGLNLDIRDQIQHITVYEDLFSPFMSGNLVILDTVDLPNLFGSAGADLLRLKIKTPSLKKEHTIDRLFHVYRLSDREQDSERSQTFVYHFVSVESLFDSNKNISKTFRGKAEDTIKKILEKDIGSAAPFNSDGTVSDLTYTSNYWSPVQNIIYCCDLAVSSADKTPDFLFYENRDGFNFKSITSLSKEEIKFTFVTDNSLSKIEGEGVNAGDVVKDLDTDFRNIAMVRAPLYYDYIKDKAAGAFSTRMFSYDFTSKKITDTTYNTNQDSRKKLNERQFYKKALIDASYLGVNSTIKLNHSHHFKLYDNTKEVSDFASKQQRISILRQIQLHKIEITVLGRTDYTVGKTVETKINMLRQFDKESSDKEIYDTLLSGKYLITAVAHRFDREGKHECTLELSRDTVKERK